MKTNETILLCICDGFGYAKPSKGNAITAANTPNIDFLYKNSPGTLLNASSNFVGLPSGQMGNSEVGHTNIGSGRVIHQKFVEINNAIANKSFFQNKAFLNVINLVNKGTKRLHIFGLMSFGGVHSYFDHFIATINLAISHKVEQIFLHCVLDGRDVDYKSALTDIKKLTDYIEKFPNVHIATMSGRYYSMDRDHRWERLDKSLQVMILQKGETFTNPSGYINNCYKNEIFDEFILPAWNTKVKNIGKIANNDGLIMINFRPDRCIQLASVFGDNNYLWKPNYQCPKVFLATMIEYTPAINAQVAFPRQEIHNTLGEVISKLGGKQLRIAETEKYAHVTFFFNGGKDIVFPGEKRILVPSPKVATYDLQPEMSAKIVTDKLVAEIALKKYDLIVLNFANPDMVGHTGNFVATVKAIEFLDKCIGRIMKVIKEVNGCFILTADHGNADKMILKSGDKCTTHSTSLVPFYVYNRDVQITKKIGKLADIAPTILALKNLNIPNEMTGDILITKK